MVASRVENHLFCPAAIVAGLFQHLPATFVFIFYFISHFLVLTGSVLLCVKNNKTRIFNIQASYELPHNLIIDIGLQAVAAQEHQQLHVQPGCSATRLYTQATTKQNQTLKRYKETHFTPAEHLHL